MYVCMYVLYNWWKEHFIFGGGGGFTPKNTPKKWLTPLYIN